MPRVRHFILRIDNAREAQRFIAGLVNPYQGYPQITTADKKWEKGQAPEYCLNIGFTYAGLKSAPAAGLLFGVVRKIAGVCCGGAVARAQVVGDTGESAPDRWYPALRNPDDVHVLLSLHARGDKELTSYTEKLEILFTQHAVKNLSVL